MYYIHVQYTDQALHKSLFSSAVCTSDQFVECYGFGDHLRVFNQ